MSKRVRIASMPTLRVNEAEIAAMRVIYEFSGDQNRAALLGKREFTERMDRAPGTVGHILRGLSDRGLIEIRESFWANGGQRENRYRLTKLGFRALKALDREGASA